MDNTRRHTRAQRLNKKYVFPNLALMKISAYHKSLGDTVNFWDKLKEKPDVVYVSTVFSQNRYKCFGIQAMYPDIKFVFGGSGYNYNITLSDEIERLMPDYDLYGLDYSVGFVSRGCIRKCGFCIVPQKEGRLYFNADLKAFIDPRFDKLVLLDNNLLGYNKHYDVLKEIIDRGLKVDFNQGLDLRLVNEKNANLLSQIKYYNHKFNMRTLRFSYDNTNDKPYIKRGVRMLLDAGIKPRHIFFYILVGFNTTFDQDLSRFKEVVSWGCTPYIMKYNMKSNKDINKLAAFCNWIPYYKVYTWEQFDTKMIGEGKKRVKGTGTFISRKLLQSRSTSGSGLNE